MSTAPQIKHHLAFSDLASCAQTDSITIIAQEAHHAIRVKRARINDTVGLLDGQGHTAIGTIEDIAGSKSKPTLTIQLASITYSPPITPKIEIFAALPKADRLDRMIDQLAQIGVSTYRPLLCDRSQRKPETIRPDKLKRIATEASKQCHRPWDLQIDDPIPFADAINDPDALLADACGIPASSLSTPPKRTVILIGPEGGFSDAERAMISATDTPIIRFGFFVLRIEAAACAAAAIMLAKTPSVQDSVPDSLT